MEKTVLMYAWNVKEIDDLLRHGAKVSLKDKNGQTALDHVRFAHRLHEAIPLLEAALKQEQAQQKSAPTATK